MNIATLWLVVALILFAIGAWSRWWPSADGRPYTWSLVCAGLFFDCLSKLWPLIAK